MSERTATMAVLYAGQRLHRVDECRAAPQVGARRGGDSVRPPGSPIAYRGSGVRTSRAPHPPRPVSMTLTVTIAVAAALITTWLAALGLARSEASGAAVPEQLAVVHVQAGENLQRLAARVAPDAPVTRVVERIRELNELESAELQSGQTLIAPVG